MTVVAILLAMTALSFRGHKTSGSAALAVSTAQAYAQAVDQFANDHAGRVPQGMGVTVSGITDWRSGSDAEWGPRDRLARQSGQLSGAAAELGSYLRSKPESVGDGRIGVGGSIGTTGTWGWIEYAPAANMTDYEIKVFNRKAGYVCSIGTKLPASSVNCKIVS